MSSAHYELATIEMEQLLTEQLIEPTNSPWASEAFYVNKRTEHNKGKMRLFINY